MDPYAESLTHESTTGEMDELLILLEEKDADLRRAAELGKRITKHFLETLKLFVFGLDAGDARTPGPPAFWSAKPNRECWLVTRLHTDLENSSSGRRLMPQST